jgi:hypothetical protein
LLEKGTKQRSLSFAVNITSEYLFIANVVVPISGRLNTFSSISVKPSSSSVLPSIFVTVRPITPSLA